MLAVVNIVKYVFYPQSFRLVFAPTQWLAYIFPAIIFAFTTASMKEILRGYVLQGIGLIIRQPFLLILISGFLATVLSFNSNQPQETIYGFILGVGLATFILKDNCLDLALGIQTARSLFPIFVLSQDPENKSNIVPTIFTVNLNEQFSSLEVSINIAVLLIRLAVFYAIFLRGSQFLEQTESTRE